MARNKVDAELGARIHAHLKGLGIETPMMPQQNISGAIDAARFASVQSSWQSIMAAMGLDLTDDSLQDTPARVADMFLEETMYGLDYRKFPKATTTDNKFKYEEMVNVNGITVQSMCEHHFQPFIGTASVAYIPKDRILGLSKFNRVVDFFSSRPQVQERLTEQVSAALRYILDTDDVAVVIRAEHFCVKLRGVRDACSNTVTSKLCGKFRTVAELRSEFLALARS